MTASPALAALLVAALCIFPARVAAQDQVQAEVTIGRFDNIAQLESPLNFTLASSVCGDSSLALTSLWLARTDAGAWKISMVGPKSERQLVGTALERETAFFDESFATSYQFIEWEGGCIGRAPLSLACRCRIVWDTCSSGTTQVSCSAIATCTLPYGDHAGTVCIGTYNVQTDN